MLNADAAHERTERVERAVHRQRRVEREAVDRVARALAHGGEHRRGDAGAGVPQRGVERGAHVVGHVGDELGRLETPDLGEHVLERRLTVERRRADVTGGDVGVRERDHVVVRRDGGEVVVRRPFEDVLFEQRPRRHDAHDVAAHELVRDRRFELLGERDDAPLRDQLGQVPVERVVRLETEVVSMRETLARIETIATRRPPPASFDVSAIDSARAIVSASSP